MRKIIPVLFLLFWLNSHTKAQVIFTPENVDVPCDATSFCVDINVTNFTDILGLQFSLQWDTAAMTLLPGGNTDFLPAPNVIYSDSSAFGKLGISWTTFTPFDIVDGDPVFQLCFAPNNAASGTVFLGGPLNGGQIEISGISNGNLEQFLPFEFETGNINFTDNQTPSIDCPGNVTIFSPGIVNNIDYLNLNDNCVASTVTYDMELGGSNVGSGTGNASGEFFNNGITTVTYTATDGSGNTGACSFTVDVQNNPTPSDTFLQIIPQVTLDCNNDRVTVEVIVLDFIDMLSMQFGVFWDSSELQLVTATANLSGANPPFYNAPDNKVFFSWPSGGSPVTQPDGTVILTFEFDLVGAFSLPALTFGNYSGPAVVELADVESGVMTAGVDYEFSPNVLQSVLDNTPPDFGTTCPGNMTLFTPIGACTAVLNFTEPTATDACDSDLDYTKSHLPGAILPVGPTTVTYTATDDAGNTSTCSFIVTVEDNTPPTITCPANPTFNCPGDVTGLAPTTSDACGLVDVTYTIGTMISGDDDASVETFDYGVTTVLYIATDIYGNSSSCSFTVTVEDNTPPSLTCPGNLTFDCPDDVAGLAATASDACGAVTITYTVGGTISGTGDASVEPFEYGVTVVTYVATDVNGNSTSCSFTVEVEDQDPPTITCPSDVTGYVGGATCTASITVPAPTVFDNCELAEINYDNNGDIENLPLGNASFTADFPIGTTVVTYIVIDAQGNSSTCNFNVTALDSFPPMLTCPSDITVTLTGTSLDTVLNNIGATANDNCGGVTLTYAFLPGSTSTPGPSSSDASGSTFGLGTTTVTYFAEDTNGQISSCSFVVTVEATSTLDITCPVPPIPAQDADAPFCSDQVQNLDLTINSNEDNVNSILFTVSGATTGMDTLDASGFTFNVGTSIVTYFVTDIFGRDASCSFEVVVVDSVRPEIVCPVLDAFPTDPNDCVATISFGLLLPTSATDNCGVDSITFELTGALTGNGVLPSGLPTVYPIGTTTIRYRVYDIYGNNRSCTVDVVVNDTEGPDMTCPGNITIDVPMGTTDTILTNLGLLSVIDACGTVVDTTYSTTGGLMLSSTNNDISGTAFPVGTTVVTYTTVDNSNNTSTCSFTVTVNEEGAMSLINCPGDINACDNLVTALPVYLVDPNTLTLSYGTDNPSVPGGPGEFVNVTLPTGSTIVTYTADDGVNTDVCSFAINVDNVNPTFANCPGVPISFNTAPGDCFAMADWTIPVPSDNCGIEFTTESHTPPVSLPAGANEIMYTATDSAGNTALCVFTVNIIDGDAPVWNTCPPSDLVLTPSPGSTCEFIATWTPPTATDACSSNITYTSFPINSGDIVSSTTVVVFTATDESGNTAICTMLIEVLDTQDPIANCPADIVVDADPSLCGYIANWPFPTATDDCSTVGISCTQMPGDTIGIGVTTVICVATDAAGNLASCSFTVTVIDNSPPTIIGCPTLPILANTTADSCGAFVSWPAPTVIDDCDTMINFTSNFQPGDYFPVGTTTIMYTAIDDGDNTVTCSFDVMVVDGEAPVADCPENVLIDLGGNITDPSGIITSVVPNATCDSIVINFTDPTFTDNCTIDSIDPGVIISGATLGAGVHTIIYTATDNSNNATTCSFTINVVPFGGQIEIAATPNDTICSGTITLSVIGGATGASYLWSGPTGWTSADPEPVLPPFNGNYSVVCTTTGGCTATANIDITYGTIPEIAATNDGPICGDGDLQLTLTGAPIGSTILWTAPPPSTLTFAVENPLIQNPGAEHSGVWTVTVSNGICEATATTEVIVGDLPNVTVNSDCNEAICLGETCTIIGQEVAGTAVIYNWDANPADCLPAGNLGSTFDFTPTTAGDCTFYYSISSGNCTSEIDSITISVSGTPVTVNDEFTIEPNDSITSVSLIINDEFNFNLPYEVTLVTPVANIPGTVVVNADGTMGYNPNGFAGVASFVYELCVNCDQELCSTGIVTINVVDESCRVPTVITPNGDDKNELLIINCLETTNFPNAEMQVFNQWGDEVFYAKPYQNDWDGTLNGEADKDLPDGTYYYIFKLDDNAEVDKGSITIFR